MGHKDKKHKHKKKNKNALTAKTADKHILYEQSVQSVDSNISFLKRTFKKHRGRECRILREDFCGTAALACAWVERHDKNEVWGVDLDPEPLTWCRNNHLPNLTSDQQTRVHLLEENVMTVDAPPADAIAAYNFSYFIFKTRDLLLKYFTSAHKGLKEDGIFFLDIFGGTSAMEESHEERHIPKSVRYDGSKVPSYTYVWEQQRFNVITNEIHCKIHFEFKDGSRMKDAFEYDWRLWTPPEVCELLLEAGFKQADVYIHGWDEDGDSDDIFRLRKYYANEVGWIGYIVAVK
jgi:SAM-dependent methyltransferase